MQIIRGYVYFENKNLSDIKNSFVDFNFDNAFFSYFTSVKINEKVFNCPGVFIDGEIKLNYDLNHVVRLFRKLLNLNDEIKNFNLSLGSQDLLKSLITDRPYGCYSCLTITRPPNLDNVEILARRINRMFSPRDLVIRTASSENKKVTCIDIIGDDYLDYNSEELKNQINEFGFQVEDSILINLIK